MKTDHFDNPIEANASVQSYINSMTSTAGDWLLEAGCGSTSRLTLPENFRLAGIDISQKQLDRNEAIEERICGDIQTYPLTREKYSLCICWDVLEHLENPQLALQNMMGAIRGDGVLILAMPNLQSLKGLVTKFSPHWFHVWYYRTILGIADAGKNDTAPFKTYIKPETRPNDVVAALEKNGFAVERLIFRDAMVYRLKLSHKWLWYVYAALAKGLAAVTLGNYGGLCNSDYIVIARKKT